MLDIPKTCEQDFRGFILTYASGEIIIQEVVEGPDGWWYAKTRSSDKDMRSGVGFLNPTQRYVFNRLQNLVLDLNVVSVVVLREI